METYSKIIEFLSTYSQNLYIIGAVGILTFLLSLFLIPLIIISLPHDFLHKKHHQRPMWELNHPILFILILIAKNLLGVLLIFAGILMLVLPGQGILTLFLGILLVNFPGKSTLERILLGQKTVLNTVNLIRKKYNKRPLTKQ